MTLEALADVDVCFGWDGNQTGVADLKSVISEIRGLTLTVVSGHTIGGTAMTLSGIATTDTIVSAFELSGGSGSAAPIDRTASINITAADTITCNEALAANSNLAVLWFDKSGR